MDVIDLMFGGQEEYEEFLNDLSRGSEMGKLPAVIRFTSPQELTMQDLQACSNMVKEDTGLGVYFQAFTCDACGDLHLQMIVFDEDDDKFYIDPGSPLQ